MTGAGAIGLFRIIAVVEGITTLALFLVAMPLKYLFDQPQYVPTVGLMHGVAFVAYLLAMSVLLANRGFSQGDWMRTAIASFFPFGTILNDPLLRRKQKALAAGV
jgi:integral membrane protein